MFILDDKAPKQISGGLTVQEGTSPECVQALTELSHAMNSHDPMMFSQSLNNMTQFCKSIRVQSIDLKIEL